MMIMMLLVLILLCLVKRVQLLDLHPTRQNRSLYLLLPGLALHRQYQRCLRGLCLP